MLTEADGDRDGQGDEEPNNKNQATWKSARQTYVRPYMYILGT